MIDRMRLADLARLLRRIAAVDRRVKKLEAERATDQDRKPRRSPNGGSA
ncbi:MAG TPA: hypothetical protein VFB22_04770 [Candidatus Baltobacteraceae bacterium]|nr:hypothetical protein [Candidatus Baltobacteraceae bacterium]